MFCALPELGRSKKTEKVNFIAKLGGFTAFWIQEHCFELTFLKGKNYIKFHNKNESLDFLFDWDI